MTDIRILEHTVCVHLDFSLWSGARSLTDDDLDEATGLPPKDLASRGAIKLCDPDILYPLSNIKRATERDCETVCVEFMGRYATHDANLTALAAKLTSRKTEFEAEVENRGQMLPQAMQDWADRHPTWKESIEREIPNAWRYAARCKFKFQFFRVGAASESEQFNDGLVQATHGLSDRLFEEIRKEATLAFKRSYENRGTVGQKAVKPLHRILSKLEALQYLDARCGAMMDRIRLVLSRLPRTGAIEEPHFSALVGLFATLGCKQAVLSHGPGQPAQAPAVADLFAHDTEDDLDDDKPADSFPVDMPGNHSPSPAPISPVPPPVAVPRTALWV